VVVLLQKLEVKTVFNLSFENFDKLCHSFLLNTLVVAGSEMLDDFSSKGLVFFVDDIECNLERL
jgi:hypothetical protein